MTGHVRLYLSSIFVLFVSLFSCVFVSLQSSADQLCFQVCRYVTVILLFVSLFTWVELWSVEILVHVYSHTDSHTDPHIDFHNSTKQKHSILCCCTSGSSTDCQTASSNHSHCIPPLYCYGYCSSEISGNNVMGP